MDIFTNMTTADMLLYGGALASGYLSTRVSRSQIDGGTDDMAMYAAAAAGAYGAYMASGEPQFYLKLLLGGGGGYAVGRMLGGGSY